MMRKRLMLGMLAGVLALSSGCSLRPDINEYQPVDSSASDNDTDAEETAEHTESSQEASQEAETTQPQLVQVEVEMTGASEGNANGASGAEAVHETVPIEELEEPVDENGVWQNYILGVIGPYEFVAHEPEHGDYGVKFHVENYPFISVLDDSEKHAEINEIIYEYVANDFTQRFQMKDIDIELTCVPMNDLRFVSYQLEGVVKHVGDDVRYEDEREYRYYFTIDRMTGQILNLETVLGIDTAYDQIYNGYYEVIRADDSVFENFSNELLADIYINEPLFADDTEHKLDFYIQGDYVYVVIWVGKENGSYAILRLYKASNLK